MQSELYRLGNGLTPSAGYAAEPERDPLVDFALRWWWLLAIGVSLGAVGAYLYMKVGPTPYSSTALIQVAAITGSDPTDKAAQARSAATNFAAEGKSTRMYDLVSQELAGTDGITASELAAKARRGELVVRQQRGTNFIEVTIIDQDPERARIIADTFASAMVRDINERSQAQNDARAVQLQAQIDFTRQHLTAAQLFDRERQLEAELRDQQQRLLGLQASYRQETSRQLEIDQLARDQGVTVTGELEGARADFETIINEQIADVEQNIDTINQELTEVREQISQLPPDTDPLVETAFAAAYSGQLTTLTTQYVQGQIQALSAGPPLTQYGEPSDPVSVQGIRKLGLLGIALGGGLAAGLGFLVDYWRKRRSQSTKQLEAAEQPLSLSALLDELEQYELSRMSRTRSASLGENPGTDPSMKERHG